MARCYLCCVCLQAQLSAYGPCSMNKQGGIKTQFTVNEMNLFKKILLHFKGFLWILRSSFGCGSQKHDEVLIKVAQFFYWIQLIFGHISLIPQQWIWADHWHGYGLRSEIWNPKPETWIMKSNILNLKSEIWNLESEIWNMKY